MVSHIDTMVTVLINWVCVMISLNVIYVTLQFLPVLDKAEWKETLHSKFDLHFWVVTKCSLEFGSKCREACCHQLSRRKKVVFPVLRWIGAWTRMFGEEYRSLLHPFVFSFPWNLIGYHFPAFPGPFTSLQQRGKSQIAAVPAWAVILWGK